jgi:phosphate transport system protein
MSSADTNKKGSRLRRLTQDLVSMAELVERNVNTAVMALVDSNSRFAYEVIALDTDIDEMEVVIDRECLELLADGHPPSGDFRFVAAAMKINNDLERISNQAVNIAEHVLALLHMRGVEGAVPDLGDLLERIEDMVRQSVEALITRDGELAWEIWEQHAAAGEDIRRIVDDLTVSAQKSPKQAARAVRLLRAAVAIGQVIEYAKDIAEEVIYMREGIIVKHHEREFRSRQKAGGAAAPQRN